MTPCPRFPAKAQHPTREDALEHQKRLVFRNATTGQVEKGRGLNVYECPHCGAWHVGHDNAREGAPLVWHYTTCDRLDEILDSGELRPASPRAFISKSLLTEEEQGDFLEGSMDFAAVPLSRTFLNRYRRGYPRVVCVPIPDSKRHIDLPRRFLEREQLLWFSRNQRWEHSIDDPTREALEWAGFGLLRFGVPASVAKLRFQDYLSRNGTEPWLRDYFIARADPTEWLATDKPVPLSKVERTEVHFNDAWVPIEDVDDDAFDRYLEEREAVYKEARTTGIAKMKAKKWPASTEEWERRFRGRTHDELLQYFEMLARELELTEAERIAIEDLFYLTATVGNKDKQETKNK